MTWDIGMKHDPATFAFVPPPSAKQIAIADLGSTSTTTEAQASR
jgi:hypothetical protein